MSSVSVAIDAIGEIAANSEPIANITGYIRRRKGLGRSDIGLEDLRARSGEDSGEGVAVRIFWGEVPFRRWALRVVTGML